MRVMAGTEPAGRLADARTPAARDLRVVHAIRVSGISGAERQLLDVLAPDALWPGIRRELLLLVAAPLAPDELRLPEGAEGLTVSTVPMPRDISVGVLRALRAAFRDADVVHTHLVHADWHALLASRGRRAAWVSSKHNHDAFREQRLFQAVERRVDRAADLTLAISASLAGFTEAVTGVAPRVVRYGHAGAADRVAIATAPPYRLLLAGRLVEQKGVDVALDALVAVRAEQPQTTLTIAGDGPLRAELEQRAQRLGVADAVRFAGWVPDATALMREHDLLVHPARWEGLGMVLLEAMALGLPIVASDAGAIPEVVGDAGVCVAAEDPAALAAAVAAVLADPARRERMARDGVERLRTQFSLEAAAAGLREAYADALAARPNGAGAR